MNADAKEHEIIEISRGVLNNPKLRSSDLLHWYMRVNRSAPHGGEVVVSITASFGNVHAAFKKSADKRKKEKP